MSEVGHDTYSDLVIDDYSEVSNRPGVLATLSGRFSVTTEDSRNGNNYTPELWESVINSDRIQEMLTSKTFFGELSHPPRDAEFLTEVQMNNVSHNITDLEFNKATGEVTGKIDILDTPSGRIANTFLKYGSRLGISSRGVTLDDGTSYNSNRMTPDNYFLITWDLVAMPGIRGARLDPVTESVIPSMAKSKLKSSKENFKSSLNSAIDAKDEEALKIFKSCIESSNLKDKSSMLSTVNEALGISESDYNTEYPKADDSTSVTSDVTTDDEELNEKGNTEISNRLKELDDESDDNTTNVSETTQADDVLGPKDTLNMIKVTNDLKEMRKPMKEAYDTLENDDLVEITLSKDQLGNLIDMLSSPEDDVNAEVNTEESSDEATVVLTKDDETSTDDTVVTATESDDPTDKVVDVEIDDSEPQEVIEDEPVIDDTVEYDSEDTSDESVLEEIKNSVEELQTNLQETIKSKDDLIEKLTAERDSAITESLMYKKKLERSESRCRVLKESYNSLETKKNSVIKKLSDKNRELLSKSAKSANESVTLKGAIGKSRTTIANLNKVVETLQNENKSLRTKLDSETGRMQNSASIRQSKFKKLAENAGLLSIKSDQTPTDLEINETEKFVSGVMSRSSRHVNK